MSGLCARLTEIAQPSIWSIIRGIGLVCLHLLFFRMLEQAQAKRALAEQLAEEVRRLREKALPLGTQS